MKKLNLSPELRDFFLLWGSQAVSAWGTAMTGFALVIWVYGQRGTASSMALLSAFSLVPSVAFSFIAGTLADRWNKKRVMLLADVVAAMGTLAVLALHLTGQLRVWHLYGINFVLSFMNAFQSPAAYVATTLLVPKAHYVRASGLQALSDSMVTILAPAFGSVLMAWGGLTAVLTVDLVTFAVAFSVLTFLIKIPAIAAAADARAESFRKSCAAGFRFLIAHTALFKMILFFSFINLIAKMGGYGMLPALILSRTGGDQAALATVEAAVGLGALAGSVLVTLMKPVRSPSKGIFLACGISFLVGDFLWSFERTLPLWICSAFACNAPLPFLSANLTAIMRNTVPVDMQGRVFSARDTLQYGTIPVGLMLGGVLADHVFEPLMASGSPVGRTLSYVFGAGKGSGVAVMFCVIGIVGCATSFWRVRDPLYRTLDEP